jgi:hypothetical protein
VSLALLANVPVSLRVPSALCATNKKALRISPQRLSSAPGVGNRAVISSFLYYVFIIAINTNKSFMLKYNYRLKGAPVKKGSLLHTAATIKNPNGSFYLLKASAKL